MYRFYSMLIASLCIFSVLNAQSDQHLLRNVSLNPDGSQMTFSYQGDIWKAPAGMEAMATRLTVHEGYESNPKWSPDGGQICFFSTKHGNADLFTLMVDGSAAPKRLTYHSARDQAPAWHGNDKIIFTTRRAFAEVEREQEIHMIDSDGGTPHRFLDAMGDMPAVSPNGRYVAFTRGNCRVAREAYRGPATHNIWLYDTKKKTYMQLTKSEAQEVYPDWGDDNTLYFMSAENGKYNVHRLAISKDGSVEGAASPMTNYTDVGVRFFDVSANGNKMVFERGSDVFMQDLGASAAAKEINVSLFSDDKFYDEEHRTFTNSMNEYALSPDEKYIAFNVRGEIFVKENDKEKKRSVRITKHAFRDQSPTWLNDTTLLFVSDRNGNKDLYMVRSTDADQKNLFKTFKREEVRILDAPEELNMIELSSDRKQMAYRLGRGKLMAADIDANGIFSNQRTLLDGWDIAEGVTWSPDNNWLAYSLEDLNFNEEIYIHPADNSSKGTNVSFHPRGDYSPVWSKDGSKLGFVSIRNNGNADIWFVWLNKEDWEKTRIDWEEDEDEPEPKKEKKKKKDDEEKDDDEDKKDEVEPIKIDFDDIHMRLEQVTRLPGSEGNLAISHDGETFYFTTNNGGRTGGEGESDWMKIKWDGSEMKPLAEKTRVYGFQWDKAGKNIYHMKRGGLAKMKVDGGKSESLPFSAKMKIDYKQEREQVFAEAWRSLNDGFYDPSFHGQDWNKLRAYYEPIALNASTTQDFRFIANEMLGQLNASHMGIYGGDPEETQNDATGLLGIEVMPEGNGVKVTKVVMNTPADKSKSKLMVGDVITHINGEPVMAGENFYAMLNQLSNEKILLGVTRNGAAEEMTIRPTRSIRSQQYESWVKERKRLTEEYSGGKLGYIHIQGMNWPSFERFERELAASGQDKEGIVIDVRFNGGGWTTDMVMAVLNVRQHSYTVPRGAAKSLKNEHKQFKETYPYGERLPLSSWTKPSIALCNQTSYSNAEIFSHAYKTLGHGTLVGMPTFGAVISTGGQGLMDGSFVRMPFRAWYVKATEENMEHGPAVPDILVENNPDSKAKGEDPQLKRAVDELLGQISRGE